jgi:hypothetical protein
MTDLNVFVTADAQVVDRLTKVFRLRQIVNLKKAQQLDETRATSQYAKLDGNIIFIFFHEQKGIF